MGISPAALTITSSATALAFPPTAVAWVDQWNEMDFPPQQFFLEWSANADTNITLARLYGLRKVPLVNADDTFVGEADDDTLTAASHGLVTGDGPFTVSNSGGALPEGLEAGVEYWIIKTSGNAFKLALSREAAFAGTAVALATDGTGTQTLSDVAPVAATGTTEAVEGTTRIRFDSYGLLGDAADGAFTVSAAGLSYVEPFRHKADTIGYAVSATLSAANAQTIRVVPEVPR